MKISKADLLGQRRMINRRLESWKSVKDQQPPSSGWIQAVRGALGLTTRQLAELRGISQGSIVSLENREADGKATLESIQKAARAMGCKLVYAIVPAEPCDSLEAILDAKALNLATEILNRAEHSMLLEKQGTDAREKEIAKQRLAQELKSKLDKRIWTVQSSKRESSSK